MDQYLNSPTAFDLAVVRSSIIWSMQRYTVLFEKKGNSSDKYLHFFLEDSYSQEVGLVRHTTIQGVYWQLQFHSLLCKEGIY